MAGPRSLLRRTANFNGTPVLRELKSFTPPEIKKKTQETRGGSLIPMDIFVGIESIKAKITIQGASAEMLSAYGVALGEPLQVDITDTLVDEDGQQFEVVYKWLGIF